MNDNPNSKNSSPCELTAAFILLRLFLGLRLLLAGVEKFESGGSYSVANMSKTMTRIATGITGASFLPLWATKIYAFTLPWVLLALGLALILGLKTRVSLFLTGLVWIGLAFGLMAVQDSVGVDWLALLVGLTAGALCLVRHNRFALWADSNV
jgi:thiosulfate dehydrogenase [quinone] large subunit